MLFEETFKTVREQAEFTIKEKGSSFIGLVFPATTENEVRELLQTIRKKHPKANHCCYAYRVGVRKEAFRFSDDREPAGSAGKPIFGAIRSHDLTNVLVLVVRYFGGTLLGIPGLIKAYHEAAEKAILKAGIEEKNITEKYKITFGYDQMQVINQLLRKNHAVIITQKMEENCIIVFELSPSNSNALVNDFMNHHILKETCKIEPA